MCVESHRIRLVQSQTTWYETRTVVHSYGKGRFETGPYAHQRCHCLTSLLYMHQVSPFSCRNSESVPQYRFVITGWAREHKIGVCSGRLPVGSAATGYMTISEVGTTSRLRFSNLMSLRLTLNITLLS